VLTESPISTEGQTGIVVAEFKVNRIVSRWLKYVALESSRGHSPFFEKGARGIRTTIFHYLKSQSSQPPSPRRSVRANIVWQDFRDVPCTESTFLKC
tara:strand:- start:28169 stop:28459 length:291 start_codon:yes stop_codon:yes gene_type:complete